MLLADQVYPFLLHEDIHIREHALRYFTDGHARSPMTAEDVWAVVDRYGWEASHQHFARLRKLPETPRSTARLIAALGSLGDDRVQYHLFWAAGWLPLPAARLLLKDAKVKQHLPTVIMDHIEARLALSNKPFEDVWSALEDHIEALETPGDFDDQSRQAGDRVTEALARFPEQASARALAILNKPELGGIWHKILAVRLFERIRHPEALDPLLRVVADDDGDHANERAVDALVHLGTTDVVNAVAARFTYGTDAFRVYAPGVLGRIKHPAAEAAALRLLENEGDLFVCTALAVQLCELCTTEALEFIRMMVVAEDYDDFLADLDELLLTIGAMQGYEPPEASEWRERLVDKEARKEERMAMMLGDMEIPEPRLPAALGGKKPKKKKKGKKK